MPRLPLDAYMTPPHYLGALLSEINVFGRVYEPCVGDGAIANAIRALPSVRKIVTNDLDDACKADFHFDATNEQAWQIRVGFAAPAMDWVITNPPFSDELAILEHTIDYAPNVAFLARLSFLEPTEDREYFLSEHPPTQVIVLPRHSFRLNDEGKKQTDNVTCAWLVWHADNQPRRMSFWSRKRASAAAVLRGLVE